jgi:hypothetical protein
LALSVARIASATGSSFIDGDSRYNAGEPTDPLLSQRFPKKQERLVRAWNVPTLVFQSADGVLWQLCDVGLGWTAFESSQPNWTTNAEVQKHLPATVISRPSSSAHWNYNFELRNNILLSVRFSSKDAAFCWNLGPKR